MRQWDHSSTPPTARSRQCVRSRQAVPDFRKSNDDDKSRYKSMRIRIYSSICMLASVIVIIYLGHLYICAMVIFIQIFMIRELFNLCAREQEEKHLPGFRLLNWHFFFTTMLFVYGRILSQHLVKTVTSDKFFYGLFTRCHMAICYVLYTIGYLRFILTLNKRNLKYQYVQYAWTHTFLIVVFAQSSLSLANIFDGIFWFLLPASLIAINDISTYFFGFYLGRTPLIKLSPKKTWEGFIGALITTMVSAFILANILGHYQWMTCPREDLSTSWLQCDPGPLFKPEYYPLSQRLPPWFPWKNLAVLPVQWHALWLGLFASVIAPFGGFFASGFKRAFEIEDFGASIPGHGGFTDRMACQLLMAIFSYIYFRSFVASSKYSVETMTEEIQNNLSFEEQKTLHFSLGQMVRQRQF